MVSRDRGQLILVGAIAIALILLGLVLIVNTALFTQVVGSEGTVESAKEGGVSGQEIRKSLGAVVAEHNRNQGLGSVDADNLKQSLVNRSVESSGAFINLSYITDTEDGNIIQQRDTGAFRNNGSDTWSPVKDSEASNVGEFLLTIDVASSSDASMGLTFDDTAGSDDVSVGIDVHPGSDEIDLDVDGYQCNDINVTDGTVRIDLSSGRVYEDGSCMFEGLAKTDAEHSIEFNGETDEIRGNYSIVTNGSVTNDDRFNGSGEPSMTDAVWSFAYEFTYDATDATVTSERREVEVYD